MLYASQLKPYLHEVMTSRGITLDKHGRAACPFHDGNNPTALSVRKDRWRCFVCDANGDAIDFVEQFDRVPFTEAIRRIAAEIGIPTEFRPRCAEEAERLNLARNEQRYFDLWAWRREKRLQARWLKFDDTEQETLGALDFLMAGDNPELARRCHERLDTARMGKLSVEEQERILTERPEELIPGFLAELYNDQGFRRELDL